MKVAGVFADCGQQLSRFTFFSSILFCYQDGGGDDDDDFLNTMTDNIVTFNTF